MVLYVPPIWITNIAKHLVLSIFALMAFKNYEVFLNILEEQSVINKKNEVEQDENLPVIHISRMNQQSYDYKFYIFKNTRYK